MLWSLLMTQSWKAKIIIPSGSTQPRWRGFTLIMVLSCWHLGKKKKNSCQRLYHLWGTSSCPLEVQQTPYTCSAERALTGWITSLQRAVRSAERPVRCQPDKTFTPGGAGRGPRGSLKTSITRRKDSFLCCCQTWGPKQRGCGHTHTQYILYVVLRLPTHLRH